MKKHEEHSAGNHHMMMLQDSKRRFWISLCLSLPVLLLSPMIQSFLGYTMSFQGVSILVLVVSTFIYFYGGWSFLKGGGRY